VGLVDEVDEELGWVRGGEGEGATSVENFL